MKEPKIYYKDKYGTFEVKLVNHNMDDDTYIIKFLSGQLYKCETDDLIFPSDVEVKSYYQNNTSHVHVINPEKECCRGCKETINVKSYYKGKDSLYKFAEEWELSSYEFDIVKRLVRCRHKGNFIEDLNKTKDLIDIYLKEQGDKYGKK